MTKGPIEAQDMRPAYSLSPLVVTTSWDDGHPSDLRLADLLHKHGIRGTFYVPCSNSEGRPVVSPTELSALAACFEIGGHTRDHIDLTTLSLRSAFDQIASNKAALEGRLGREIIGFAYVRGHYNPAIRDLVKQAGYRYARCIRGFSSRPGSKAFDIPTTVQFFRHSRFTYAKNFLRGGPTLERLLVLSALRSRNNITRRCFQAALACAKFGTHFHLWGHSWELDQYDLWTELDEFLAQLRTLNARFVSNSEWLTETSRAPQPAAHPGHYIETGTTAVGS